ncbi:hypothetical protein HBH70_171860 [Parastagonospora nodorum]|nr:hypothetical protein HBI09_170410 [Parastagonospora nodorum]KAH4206821.1 hypothetical protein HBI95_121060 [Parastagonospora nodorum]KAH4253542.1 hypothetical protein HBI03_193980 [Parastagonospora nodorum]KAH4261406.1 hypothetical protein HBI04_203360 [Parastagonospora nodorum]KAH4599470.1 hypothetical protein HBH82_204240 [Parastagonospora nodorum]
MVPFAKRDLADFLVSSTKDRDDHTMPARSPSLPQHPFDRRAALTATCIVLLRRKVFAHAEPEETWVLFWGERRQTPADADAESKPQCGCYIWTSAGKGDWRGCPGARMSPVCGSLPG